MITRYRVKNFKQLRDVEVDFQQVNVLIGPNGAGKSSLLQSIDFLKAFMVSSIDYYLEKQNIVAKELYSKDITPKQDDSGRRTQRRVLPHRPRWSRGTVFWDMQVQLQDSNGKAIQYRYEVYLNVMQASELYERLSIIDNEANETLLFKREGGNYRV